MNNICQGSDIIILGISRSELDDSRPQKGNRTVHYSLKYGITYGFCYVYFGSLIYITFRENNKIRLEEAELEINLGVFD